jgi:hypothetical protein
VRGAKPQQEEGEGEESPGMLVVVYWLGEYFPGFFRLTVLIASLVLTVLALGIGILALVVGVFGAVIAAMLIGGFALLLYWTAVAWVLSGEICMPAEALADFNGTQWMLFVGLTALPIGVCMALLGLHGTA